MPSLDQLEAFVGAAEQGSFSAAARRLGKVQSAISNAIMNLEIETNLELFDRSSRNPTLTEAGKALLAHARSVLRSHHEFLAHASSLGDSPETRLCVAIEQSIWGRSLLPVLEEFEIRFPFVTLELLDPGGSDVADLLRDGRAEIGLMVEQEVYPKGFRFRGVGHSRLIAVCRPDHPLVQQQPVSHTHLRRHRQLVAHSRNPLDDSHERHQHSPKSWLSESPYIILELVCGGLGWALLHETVVNEKLTSGELVALELAYQQSDNLQGVDVVWTENRPLGKAGQWLLEQLQGLDFRR
jgi:DNA-binding transcriptional LysR family regulator